jgi:hypothetical protein
VVNHLHHFGMAFLAAPIWATMSYYGIIGPVASLVFLPIRITIDQIIEIPSGAGDWPWTWPINEQWVDITVKGFYAFVVGYLTDKYVRGVDWFDH